MYDLGGIHLLPEGTYPLEATYSAKGNETHVVIVLTTHMEGAALASAAGRTPRRHHVDNAHGGRGGHCFRGEKNPTSSSC